ncbi:MAG: hypothetical protein AMS21_05570 [Gemmatimonas sp. SG8_38_2]|nr:MAG: hypothetical protein AMS21_05570 [Gemmatimonas sp. SG8_38_2]
MRVFVAINPPREVRARIGEAERDLREAGFPIRWVPAENVHLTLKFRPSVVWLGVELDSVLSSLQARTEENLSLLGFPREDRPFRPHLTLGRSRKRAEMSEFRGLETIVSRLEYSDSFRVGTVDVMSSRLMPTGAVYDVIHRAELGDKIVSEQGA